MSRSKRIKNVLSALRHRCKVMTLTPSVRAMSLCSFPCVARPFACASFVAISALECFLFLAVAACIRILPMLLQIFIVIINMINMTNMRVGGYVVPRITCPKFIRATKIDDTQCCGARGARSMGQPADMVASCCETGPMSGQLSVAHHTIIPAKIKGVDMLNTMKSSAPEKEKSAAANAPEVMGRTVQPHDQAWARSEPITKAGTASCIGSDMSIVGNIECKGPAQVFGRIEGELRASDLLINDGAQVEGNVIAQNVTVCGRVKGAIRAVRVKLQNGGAVEGDIFHRSLSIDENSQFEGSSRAG